MVIPTPSNTPKSFVNALSDTILPSMKNFITAHENNPLNEDAYYAILTYLSENLYPIASSNKLRLPIIKVEKLSSPINEDNVKTFNEYFKYFEKILIVIKFKGDAFKKFKKAVDDADVKALVNYDHYSGNLPKFISKLGYSTNIPIDAIVLNIYDLCVLINKAIFGGDIYKMIESIHLMNSIDLFEDKEDYVKIKANTAKEEEELARALRAVRAVEAKAKANAEAAAAAAAAKAEANANAAAATLKRESAQNTFAKKTNELEQKRKNAEEAKKKEENTKAKAEEAKKKEENTKAKAEEEAETTRLMNIVYGGKRRTRKHKKANRRKTHARKMRK
jgi:hypothetical protein